MLDTMSQAILDAFEGIAYVVDLNDTVVAIGRRAWSHAATKNGIFGDLPAEEIIGRNLFDFIEGAEVQETYRRFNRALLAEPDKKIVFPYRCDTPNERQDLRMCISALKVDGSVWGFLYVSTPVAIHRRPAVNLVDFTALMRWANSQTALPIISACSLCMKFAGPDQPREWVEATEYYRRGGTEQVRISHGICDNCMVELVEPQLSTA